MTETLCKYCGKDITYKLTYYISVVRYGDTPLCYECYQYPVEEKEVKYTKYNRFDIIDI